MDGTCSVVPIGEDIVGRTELGVGWQRCIFAYTLWISVAVRGVVGWEENAAAVAVGECTENVVGLGIDKVNRDSKLVSVPWGGNE